jgi:cysteinyl-tRNA synthetase
MPLFLHDTLQRKKVEFTPRDPKRITMYVCGPTVYNYAHIGNARPVVVFDVLFRLLQRLYPDAEVIYARNFTDVDDRINAKAIAEGVDISVITKRFADVYEADMAALNALQPTHSPRATDHMPEMARLIEAMIQNGAAYVSEGEVLFDVPRYEANGGDYGALSGRSLDDLLAGARVEVADNKRNPADFVLWKPSKPGEPEWDGPQGMRGRPGWHIECSAMSEKVLGLPIDIHGGGHDLIFPHHTNEIAQSCAAHGAAEPEAYARYWMHNGFLDFSGEKMSKSLGNVVLVHDLVKQYPGEVIRWALLSGHYRSPLDWTPELLERSRTELDKLYGTLRDAYAKGVHLNWHNPNFEARSSEIEDAITVQLQDDLNTPGARRLVFATNESLRAELNWWDGGDGHAMAAAIFAKAILSIGQVLGVLQQDPDAWFEGGASDDLKAKVEALIAARIEARAAKDFAAADRIRDELTALNVVVMDSPTGATWRLKD